MEVKLFDNVSLDDLVAPVTNRSDYAKALNEVRALIIETGVYESRPIGEYTIPEDHKKALNARAALTKTHLDFTFKVLVSRKDPSKEYLVATPLETPRLPPLKKDEKATTGSTEGVTRPAPETKPNAGKK